MKKPRVLVLGGGYSPEREVSIRSSHAVKNALESAGYHTGFYDPGTELLEKSHKLAEIVADYDVVLPILHGAGGEDGSIQEVLQDLGIPFLGSDSHSSECGFDKIATRNVIESCGFYVPEGKMVDFKEARMFIKDHPAFVLKPRRGGSSIDTLVSREEHPVDEEELEKLFKKYDSLLVEELIDGIEITVPILGSRALHPIAIIPPKGEEFDFENKYNGETQEICPIPETLLAPDLANEAMQAAEIIHGKVNARHLSRVDMIITAEGKIFVLEINTMPGLTDKSLYPKSAKEAGISMPELVTKFVEMALT